MKAKKVPEEVYVPEEQVVYNDATISERLATIKIIQGNLIKPFIVADLDRDEEISDFLKVDYAHAIGVLEGKGAYDGIDSSDETWLYEYENGDGTKKGGVAVIRDKKVIDYYPVWQGVA